MYEIMPEDDLDARGSEIARNASAASTYFVTEVHGAGNGSVSYSRAESEPVAGASPPAETVTETYGDDSNAGNWRFS